MEGRSEEEISNQEADKAKKGCDLDRHAAGGGLPCVHGGRNSLLRVLGGSCLSLAKTSGFADLLCQSRNLGLGFSKLSLYIA